MKKRLSVVVSLAGLAIGLFGSSVGVATGSPQDSASLQGGSCGLVRFIDADRYFNCSSFPAHIRIIWNSNHDPSVTCISAHGHVTLGPSYSVKEASTFATC